MNWVVEGGDFMNRKIRLSGPCPETGKSQQIEVTFLDVFCGGQTASGFKKDAYYCAYASDHGCAARGDRGLDCPLYKRAHLV